MVSRAMSDEEENHIDESAHRKLLAGINSIVRTQDVQKATRTEPTLKRSEFSLVKAKYSTEDGGSSKRSSSAIKVDDILGILKKTGKNTELGKELVQIKKKKKVLSRPLEKPVADRIERDTLYGKTQKNLDLWEPVITASEVAPQTVFPLQYGKVGLANEAPQKLSQYRVKSDLMRAMEELDKKYKKEVSEGEGEETDQYALTLEELRQKRKEAARQKLRESYKIAKGRRLNKIKSKKFHRLMKRDKIRGQIKQFEELQKSDPEAALKQLELIEKQRHLERATLRHKNTGSWAKNMQIRAKYDMNVRQELAEQLSIGKELMGKRMQGDESSESDEEEEILMEDDREDNPWVRKKGEHEEEANREFTSGYRKYWEQRNQVEETKKQMKENESVDDEEDEDEEAASSEGEDQNGSDSEDERAMEIFKNKVKKSTAVSTTGWQEEELDGSDEEPSKPLPKGKKRAARKELNMEEMFDDAEELLQKTVQKKLQTIRKLTEAQRGGSRGKRSADAGDEREEKSSLAFKKKASLADADIELDESGDKRGRNGTINIPKIITGDKLMTSVSNGASTTEAAINPKQFVEMKPKHLLNAIPDFTTGGELSDDENDDDPEHSQKLTIAEAFEDDDIVADFEREKEDERDRNRPKEVDMSLPGWGSWGGTGIKEKKPRKTRRKIFKKPAELPRRDDNKERVIINEDAVVNKKLTAHLVNELPFPFVSVKDYEASLRAPLGRTFLPETAHSTLVEPRVVTKMGAVIEPMKKDILLQDAKTSFRVGGKQFNKAVKKYEEFLEANES